MKRVDQMKAVKHRCLKCDKAFSHDSFAPFCECGGMVEVEYDLDRSTLYDSENPLERFIDILPVEDPTSLLRVPMEYTPCVHARKIGALLNMPRLYLKDETAQPTRTTKYRMGVVSLAFLSECGVKVFCTSSTGNSSTAYAHAIANYPECRMFLFTAESFSGRVSSGAEGQVVQFVLRDATFVDAFDASGAFAARHKLVSERGFFNPGRREGLKIAFLEATDQIPDTIDWYVQAVSSAMGVYGTYKGAQELLALKHIERLPRLLCVQQETCCPMVKAWNDGSPSIKDEHIFRRPTGIAEAILRGDPSKAYPHVRRIVLESNGSIVAVSEQEIRDARKMAEEYEGVYPCFSASAALAGLIKQAKSGSFPLNDTVMVNLTGGDRPRVEAADNVHWLKRSASGGWEPEDPNHSLTVEVWNNPYAEI